MFPRELEHYDPNDVADILQGLHEKSLDSPGGTLPSNEARLWELAVHFKDHVIFEDNDILVLNKPPQVLSHGNDERPIGLAEVARYITGETTNLVHRLDRDTTGVIILGKNDGATDNLVGQFFDKEKSGIKKTYLTVVNGQLPFPLGKQTRVPALLQYDSDLRSVVDATIWPQNKRSSTLEKSTETKFRTISVLIDETTGKEYSLVEVDLVTGRTHQIRAVAAALGTPICGDSKYGVQNGRNPGRYLLHARRLGVTHPTSGESIQFEASTPDDMTDFLRRLTPKTIHRSIGLYPELANLWE